MSLKQRDWVGWVLKNAELYISMKEKQRIIFYKQIFHINSIEIS